MRVAFYIDREVHVDCRGEPIGDAEPPQHFSVEIDFTNSNDAVTLEGNAYLVREALIRALDAIEDLAEEMVEDGDLDPNWDRDPNPAPASSEPGDLN